MDGSQQRGRSPSSGQHAHHISSSGSSHRYGIQNTSIDPTFSQPPLNYQQTGELGDQQGQQSTGGPVYNLSTPWQAQSQQFDSNNSGFLQNQGFTTAEQDHYSPGHNPTISPFGQQQSSHQQQDFFTDGASGNIGDDFTLFQNTTAGPNDAFDSAFLMDQTLQNDQQNQSINPADLLTTSSPHQNQNPHTPPSLLQPEDIPSAGQISPSSLNPQHSYHSPRHSRHASLDPATANFPQGQPTEDWSGVNFQTHRRVPSDHSDVSSAAPSPFLTTAESFDSTEHHHSPSLIAQSDNVVDSNVMGIGQFTLSDSQLQQQQRISPGHSPHISPQVSPNQEPGEIQVNPFLMTADMNSHQFNRFPETNFYDEQESFPTMNHDLRLGDSGQQNQMAPPEINIEFALPSRQSSFGLARGDEADGALFPPDQSRRGRMRARSDPYTSASPISRPLSVGSQSGVTRPKSSLSPGLAVPTSSSRSQSPSSKSNRRSSTSSIPHRDYILDLADPTRPGAGAADSKRIQKHPATFQCTLCPKKFTRAYNLRSHLRTHTDERPFVCTVCGKAFARQHDRKRHEGLHSGEKKFMCKGELKTGGAWGCGRRFARADALGRHFKSEAGRICIKPLLDEEKQERQRTWQEQQMLAQSQGMQVPSQMAPMDMGMMESNGSFTLPAALLAQYPEMGTLHWDTLPQGDPHEAEISGRSSFDASSGGEYFDDEEQAGYVSGPGTSYAGGQTSGWNGNEWASDYEGGR